MPAEHSRRAALSILAAALSGGLAGCLDTTDGGTPSSSTTTGTPPTGTPPTDDGTPTTTANSPSDDGSSDPGDWSDGRPTVTRRDPEPLDVGGAWTQTGSGPGHDGVSEVTAVPDDGTVHWHIRRVRSGPPVLADGLLAHYAKVGEDTSGRATVTRTREKNAGTAHPVYGVPALVVRDAADGQIQWVRSVPSRRDEQPGGTPAVAGDRIVAATPGQVAAYDRADGGELWRESLGEKDTGEPAVVNGVAVVPVQGSVKGDTYVRRPAIRAFDVADGSELWSVEPSKRATAVAIEGDTVVVLSWDYDQRGTLTGRARSDGSEQWSTTVPGAFFDLPVVADGTVYVTNGSNTVRALSTADGSERWSRRVGGEPARVAATSDTVYAATVGRVLALATDDGHTRWSVETGDAEYAAGIAVGREAVYAGLTGIEAPIHALARDDGTERWHHSFPNQVVEGDIVRSGVATQPVVAEGSLYVNAVDGLYAFGPK